MFCEKCGAKINKNSKFCANCGQAIAGSKESNKEMKKKKGNKFLLLLIIGIAITIFGVFCYSDYSKPVSDDGWKYTYEEKEEQRQDGLAFSKLMIGLGICFTAGSIFYKVVSKE